MSRFYEIVTPERAREFLEYGELDDLYDQLYEYYLSIGEMPYGTAKARDGDPYQWISDRLERDLTTMQADLNP